MTYDIRTVGRTSDTSEPVFQAIVFYKQAEIWRGTRTLKWAEARNQAASKVDELENVIEYHEED